MTGLKQTIEERANKYLDSKNKDGCREKFGASEIADAYLNAATEQRDIDIYNSIRFVADNYNEIIENKGIGNVFVKRMREYIETHDAPDYLKDAQSGNQDVVMNVGSMRMIYDKEKNALRIVKGAYEE